MNREPIVLGALYHLKDRFGYHRTGNVMKITGLGNEIPQWIYGTIWFSNGSTAQCSNPEKLSSWDLDKNHAVFACEIGPKLTDEEIAVFRHQHAQRITEFWGEEKAPELAATG